MAPGWGTTVSLYCDKRIKITGNSNLQTENLKAVFLRQPGTKILYADKAMYDGRILHGLTTAL